MHLPNYIKPYPRVIAWLLPKFGGNSLYPFIFLRQETYQALTSNQPSPLHLATLAHELHHRQRQQSVGWIMWGLKYLLSRQFRFEEELSAYNITMQIRKYYQQDFNLHHCAKALSGSMYLWATSYQNAYHHLSLTWKEAKPINPKSLIPFT